jgi:MraZ protein
MDEWSKFQDKTDQSPGGEQGRKSIRQILLFQRGRMRGGQAGKATIPQNLREHAKIDKELVTIGVLSKIEIWSKQEWDNYNEGTNLGPDEIAEKMAEFGI